MSYTMEFILASVFISLTINGFMSLCIILTIAENGRLVVKWIVGVVLAVAISCGISGLVALQNKGDDKARNNGYYTECNKPYRFVNAVYHTNSNNEYYYTYDSCGHTIIVHGLRER